MTDRRIAKIMVLKLGHFGKEIKKTWKVLKCGAEERQRRSVGPTV